MTEGKKYIRKKGDKYIIEQKIDGKTIYLKTLNIEKYLEWSKRHDEASQITPINEKKTPEKFAYSLLNELEKGDAKKEITEEDRKLLWEITKE